MSTGAIGFTMAMALEHAIMLIAMLLRIDEYGCDHSHRSHPHADQALAAAEARS
jgi:hypothetical protein